MTGKISAMVMRIEGDEESRESFNLPAPPQHPVNTLLATGHGQQAVLSGSRKQGDGPACRARRPEEVTLAQGYGPQTAIKGQKAGARFRWPY